MADTINELPKGHPSRIAIAKQVRETRNIERAGIYNTERSGVTYVEELMGLEHLFEYIRGLGNGTTVLDVGAGVTKGVSQLAESSMGRGLDFKATVLVRDEEVEAYLGEARTRSTYVEALHGIADQSVGGILGLFSIAYSDKPELAAASVDRVLLPGGAIKGAFMDRTETTATLSMLGMRTGQEFESALKGMGYDVAVEPGPSEEVLLAIKPGSSQNTSARELLIKDKATFGEQAESLEKELLNGE